MEKIIFNILLLLFAHFVGDYLLQTDYMAREKCNSIYILLVHSVIYTFSVFTSLLLFSFIIPNLFLFAIFISHMVMDYLKSRKYIDGKYSLFIDQSFHLIVLGIVMYVI